MSEQHYFLGANSPSGFYGYFQKAYGNDWRVWLLKGGPGSGKSTLLRRAVQLAGGEWEYVHCSSDPKSLDAVLHPEKKLMLADATSPHAMEARLPGCVEQLVDLGEGFDVQALRGQTTQAAGLAARNAALHRQAVHWLAAAAQVQSVRLQQAAPHCDADGIRRLAAEWLADGWPQQSMPGEERLRGLCAVTPDGVLFYGQTVAAVADTVYVLQDDWGAAAPLLLAELRRQLLKRGYLVTVCRCSLFPESKLEHLLLPRQRVAFVTSNAAHRFTAAAGHEVDLRSVYGAAPATPQRLQQLLRQENTLLAEACACMQQAREVHDALEQCYRPAMRFAWADQKAEQLGSQLRQLLAG